MIKKTLLSLMLLFVALMFVSSCDVHKHSYVETVIEPTCTEQGYTIYRCTCGDEYNDNYVSAKGHNYITSIIQPTCTEKGYTLHKCACGDEYKIRYVNAKGHKYVDTVVNPTCTEQGYTTHKCACGDEYIDNYVSAKGHKYVTSVIQPTCTAEGYTIYTCECGDEYMDDYIIAKGHEYVEEIKTVATRTNKGEKMFKCMMCDYSYNASYELEPKTSTEIYNNALLTVGEVVVYDKAGTATALGSSFCIDSTGKFVTNYHVVDDAYSATIEIDGKKYDVSNVLAYDEDIDLAVLKVSGTFSKVDMYGGDLIGGETVYAMGSSEGLTLSFSNGIVASPSREMDSVLYVQHTAPISHGNSGGPLFDEYGYVIGINTSAVQDAQNLNFAIRVTELDNLQYVTTTLKDIYDKNHPTASSIHGNYYFEAGDYIISERESNNSMGLADSITVNGTTVQGSVNKSSDIDYFKFQLGANETVIIVYSFDYNSDTKGSLGGVFDSSENCVAASSYASETKTMSLSFTNYSSYTRTFYFALFFGTDYVYRNTVGDYLIYFIFHVY